MSTVFANLPVSAGDGVGAGVDVSGMGATRTVSVKGTFTGTVTVEISADGGTSYVPLASFTEVKQRTFQIAAEYMRVRRSGGSTGTPNVDVGGDDIGSLFASLPVPAGNGVGAGVDVSALGTFNTLVVSGAFTGSITIQISLDNVDWLPLFGFSKDGFKSKRFIAQYIRVVRSGIGAAAGSPTVSVGASNDPIGTGGIGLDRTIIVAKAGGDANTIEDGITAVNALVPAPSSTNPAGVWVFPGVYTEDPLTVPEGVTLWGQSAVATIIEASTPTSPLVTLEAGAEINSATLTGANGVGGIGLLANQAGTALARTMFITDCTLALQVTGANVFFQMLSVYVLVNGGVLDCGIECAAGAVLDVYTSRINGSGSGCGVRSTGANSTIHGFSIHVGEVASALRCASAGGMEIVGGLLHDCTYGFHIDATGGDLHAYSVDVEDVTTYDLYIEAANGTFRGAGNAIRSDQISVHASSSVVSTHLSDFSGDRANMIIGELAVGLPGFPSESVFGEGDSHVRTMAVFRNTNLEAGAWSDITTEMASASGSTAAAFAGVAAGNCVYIGGNELGGDGKPFPGLKINTTVAIALGAGAVVWEYWNGAAWTSFTLMACDSTGDYDSHSTDVFGRVANEQVRFDCLNMTGWAQKALNGTTRYWVRCRITTGITTSPTLEQIKLHANRTEINADGRTEHMGTGIEQRNISWHQRMTDDLSGASPTNGALALTANITITPIDNEFNDNALDGFGGIFTIPQGLDTSRPVTLRWNWAANANATAPNDDVEFESRSGPVRIGDTINGTISDTLQTLVKVIGAADANVLKQDEFTFDVSSLVPGDLLAFSLYRDGQPANLDDTYNNDIRIVTVELLGWFWR